MISVIVPVFYKNKGSYILKRVYELIKIFKDKKNYELIIIDSSNKKYINNISYKNIQIISFKCETSIFSPALLRNESIKYVKGEYLFFFDVDLSFNDNFLNQLTIEVEEKIEKNNNSFLMLPCFYLSNEGTVFYEKQNTNNSISLLRESFMLGDNKYVERLAINTSAIIIKKDYFINIGKFSDSFSGHGGEDFELLHRLIALSPKYKKTKDYYDDTVSQFVADYSGFRKYMSFYSIQYLFGDLALVHKWHKRPLFNKFYFKRVKNEALLKKKMIEFDKQKYFLNKKLWDSSLIIEDYKEFLIKTCKENGYFAPEYIGFFKYNQNVKIRKRPYSAKIRKLLTRPKLFIKDMKIFNK